MHYEIVHNMINKKRIMEVGVTHDTYNSMGSYIYPTLTNPKYQDDIMSNMDGMISYFYPVLLNPKHQYDVVPDGNEDVGGHTDLPYPELNNVKINSNKASNTHKYKPKQHDNVVSDGSADMGGDMDMPYTMRINGDDAPCITMGGYSHATFDQRTDGDIKSIITTKAYFMVNNPKP